MAAKSITTNIKFTAKVPLLLKATSNDEKPTQGYHLQEINSISKSSLPHCQSLLTFLLGRLEKREPCIKFKVLHILKYLVVNGHSEFRSQLYHNAKAIKDAVDFIGELDPVHGDGLNVKVRQAAADLEKLLFDADNPNVEVIYKSMVTVEGNQKKLEGFGYSRTPDKQSESPFMDALIKVKNSTSGLFYLNKSVSKFPVTQNQLIPNPVSQPRYTPVHLEDNVAASLHVESIESIEKCGDAAMTENSFNYFHERELVNNITSHGVNSNIPDKELLKDFVNQASRLEFSVILDFLDEKLKNSNASIQLKSLHVIEYLLRSKLTNVPRQVKEHCPSISLLVQSQTPSVVAKVKKIILSIDSCLAQKNDSAVIPPSYTDAIDLPEIDDPMSNSLFTGMNITRRVPPDEVNRVSDELSDCPTKNLIDVDNANDNLLVQNAASPRTSQNEKKLENNEFTSSLDTAPKFPSNSELLKLGDDGKHFVQDFEKMSVECSKSDTILNHLDLLHLEYPSPNVVQNASDLTGDLLLANIDNSFSNQNHSTGCTAENTSFPLVTTSLPNPPDRNSLSFQSGLATPMQHRSLFLHSSTPTTGFRRTLPKDMKTETDGFNFVRTSKSDTFSFVQDEIRANKANTK